MGREGGDGAGAGGRAGRARQATRPAEAEADPLVSLNLPENTPLKVLIDYYSQEFGVNILYDDQVADQRITIQAPAKLPRSAVPSLLDSALKMKGFSLVNADHPGWKRIVTLNQAAKVPGTPATQPAAAVTQVFKLQYTDATRLDLLVKPFLTQPGASSFPLPDQGLLVVTDYGSNLGRVSDLVRAVDQPSQDVTMEFLPVKHADPARLTQQVDQLLKAKLRTQGGGERLAGSIETGYDARTNTIVVIAPKDRMDDAREIVRSLDTVVTEQQSPIHFYRLANTTAADVLSTIRGLEGEDEQAPGAAVHPPPARPHLRPAQRIRATPRRDRRLMSLPTSPRRRGPAAPRRANPTPRPRPQTRRRRAGLGRSAPWFPDQAPMRRHKSASRSEPGRHE